MGEQNKSQFHCNNKGRHYSDPGYKPVCESQCADFAEFCPAEQPQESKQLTAEEMQHRNTHRDIMIDLHRREMNHDGGVLSFRKGFDEGYLLAARDKNQALADHVKATASLREELEQWKTAYRDVNETSEARLKNNYRLREELDQQKEATRIWKEQAYEYSESMRCVSAELEAVKKERDTFSQNVEMFRQEVKKRTDFADWVTRQRDMWKETAEKVEEEAKEMANQRDEAVDLLENWKTQNPSVRPKYRKPNQYQAVLLRRDNFLSRISSGETKPVAHWMKVNDLEPPSDGKFWLWDGVKVRRGLYGPSGAGDRQFWEYNGNEPELSFPQYYMECKSWEKEPAPPESLTDKSKV